MGNDNINAEGLNIDNEKIPEDIINTDSVVNINEKEQLKHYNNLVSELSEEAIKNQAEQILNYSDNDMQSGSLPVTSLYENCSMTIKDYISKDAAINSKDIENFKKSLDISQDCIIEPERYKKAIYELDDISNHDYAKKSFIMAPISATGHMFSSVIYKNGENYEIVVVNKGGRYDTNQKKEYHSFEKYVIPKENIDNILPLFGTFNDSLKMPQVISVYQTLEDNSIDKRNHPLLNIEARNQRVGNCYFKEVEEGLKYAYAEAFGKYEKNEDKFIDNDNIEKITPKLPCDTKEFHKALVNNLKNACRSEDSRKFIDELVDEYDKNKSFRDKINENINLSKEEKEKIFFEAFRNNNQDVNKEGDFKECLAKVDERTLIENISFFIDMLEERNIKVPSYMYDTKNRQLDVDFLRSFEKNLRNNQLTQKEDAEFMRNYFPVIGRKIEKRIKGREIGKIIEQIKEEKRNGNLDVAITLADKCFLMQPNRDNKILLYENLGEIKEEQGYLKEAMELYKKAYDESKGIDFNIAKRVRDKHNLMISKIQDNINSINEFKEEVSQVPELAEDISMKNFMAELLKKAGDMNGAVIEYNEIIDSLSKDGISNDNYKDIISALTQKASLLKELKEFGQEREVYKSAINMMDKLDDTKNNIEMIEIKADILKELGETSEAMKLYQDTLKIMGENNADDELKDKINKKINGMQLKKEAEKDINSLKMDKGERAINDEIELQNMIKHTSDEYDINNMKDIAKKLVSLERNQEAVKYYLDILEKTFDKESFCNAVKLLRESDKTEDALLLANKEIQKYNEKMLPQDSDDYIRMREEKLNCLVELDKKEEILKESKYMIENLKLSDKGKEYKEMAKNIMMTRATVFEELGDKEQALLEYKRLYNTYKDESLVVPRNLRRNLQEISKDTNKSIEQHTMIPSVKRVKEVQKEIANKKLVDTLVVRVLDNIKDSNYIDYVKKCIEDALLNDNKINKEDIKNMTQEEIKSKFKIRDYIEPKNEQKLVSPNNTKVIEHEVRIKKKLAKEDDILKLN